MPDTEMKGRRVTRVSLTSATLNLLGIVSYGRIFPFRFTESSSGRLIPFSEGLRQMIAVANQFEHVCTSPLEIELCLPNPRLNAQFWE